MNVIKNWLSRLVHGKRADAHAQTAIEEVDVGSLEACDDGGDTEQADEVLVPDAESLGLDVDRAFYPWLLDLECFSDRPLTPSEACVLESFEQLVTGQASSANLLPRLPRVIPQLMRGLKDDRVTGVKLARQIAKDPVLVGEVIRLANSPYYRRSRKVSSIEHAVVVLGRDGLNQLIARVAFYPIFNLRAGHVMGQAASRVWAQSERCAVLCHCLAEQRRGDVFAAYLAGLVASVGVVVGFRLMDQSLDRHEDPIPDAGDFYRPFLQQAGRLSHRILSEWDFPEGVIQAVQEQVELRRGDSVSWLGLLLSLADRYSKLSLLLEHQRLSEDALDLATVLEDPCYRQLSLREPI